MIPEQTLSIPVPRDLPPTHIELVKAAVHALIKLRCDCNSEWGRFLADLHREGWHVQWQLQWVAEARREGEFERSTGQTLDEAMGRLEQLTRLTTVKGTP